MAKISAHHLGLGKNSGHFCAQTYYFGAILVSMNYKLSSHVDVNTDPTSSSLYDTPIRAGSSSFRR